jgi:hypothetical protein
MRMTLFIAAIPGDAESAARHGFPIAHMAYRLGIHGLDRARLPAVRPGDLMVLDDHRRLPEPNGGLRESRIAAYVADISHELTAHRFAGLLADFERPPCPFTESLLAGLSKHVPVLYDVQSLVPCHAHKPPPARFGRRGLAAEVIRPADARGLAETIKCLEQNGFDAAFLLYPEVAGMLGDLVKLL